MVYQTGPYLFLPKGHLCANSHEAMDLQPWTFISPRGLRNWSPVAMMCYPDQMWAHRDIKPWDGPRAPVLGASHWAPLSKHEDREEKKNIASTSFETCESLRNVDWIEMEIWKSLDITGSWQPTHKKNLSHPPATCWNSHPGTDVHAFSLPTTDAPLLRFGGLEPIFPGLRSFRSPSIKSCAYIFEPSVCLPSGY